MFNPFNLKSTEDLDDRLIKITRSYWIYGCDIDHKIKEKWQVAFFCYSVDQLSLHVTLVMAMPEGM